MPEHKKSSFQRDSYALKQLSGTLVQDYNACQLEAEAYRYIKSCWLDKKWQHLQLCNDLITIITDVYRWSHW